jgi:hypothetical protein
MISTNSPSTAPLLCIIAFEGHMKWNLAKYVRHEFEEVLESNLDRIRIADI